MTSVCRTGRPRALGWPFASAVLGAAALFLVPAAHVQSAEPADRLWFCPGPGTLDYRRLFEHPEEWAHARQLVSVFKFYQQHTLTPADPIVGPNSYDALVRSDAFRRLTKWRKKIALEVGAVKEFYCTSDASGMKAAIDASIASVRAVRDAGGTVDYLAMDEPFAAGRSPVCGGPALEPTAARVATYVSGVHAAFPTVRVGLIEAYPFSGEPAIESMLELLRVRGAAPAFLHVDADLNAIRAPASDFTRDMTTLQAVCRTQHIAFGIIIWGHDFDADALYTADAGRLVNALTAAFPNWAQMPDQMIVQSWAQTRSGLRITPANLPEDRDYTHTNLLWQTYRRLRGQSGPVTGVAIPR